MRNVFLAAVAMLGLALGACAATPGQERALNGAAMGTASGVTPPSVPFENPPN